MSNDENGSSGDMSLVGLAWTLIGAMIGCPLLGYVIGQRFADEILGVLIGGLTGLIYSFYEIWKFTRKSP